MTQYGGRVAHGNIIIIVKNVKNCIGLIGINIQYICVIENIINQQSGINKNNKIWGWKIWKYIAISVGKK